MCKLKSAIVLKNRIFVPDYDSHTKMLEELGIEDDYLNASKTFVRVELSPKNGDVFSDIDTWELNVDQDIIPDWFDKETYKPQIVDAIKGWAKDSIHIGIDNLEISAGEIHYIKDCTNVTICGYAKANICGSSTVKNICGYSTVNICDSATVEYICGYATVKNICGSSTVKNIYGYSTVNICDSATVEYIYGYAKVNICDSATVENICGYAKANICGSSTVKNIYGYATVNICDSATVKNIRDSATVDICDSATVENIRDSATVNICDSATVEKAKGSCVIIGSNLGWNKKDTLILAENATFKDCETKTIYQAGDWELVNVKGGKINE